MDGIATSVPLIARPSFDRACSFVPSEYVQAWEWFLREEQRGGLWDKLPHRTNADSPQYPFRLTIESELFPVSRDSGIFWPGRGRVKHPREKTFALSVHNSKRGAYPDVPPLYLEDGTWVLKYSSQSASVENWRDQDYNQKMINCMECSVSARSSLRPIPVDAPSRVAMSTQRSKLRISRTTRVPSRRLPATVFCCAATCIRCSMPI